MIHLVTGGARSGKSRYAERLLTGRDDVTYLAPHPGPGPTGDAEWQARVAAHRSRRPASWSTVESVDVRGVVGAAPGPVLLDCLGTWVTNLVDAAGLWDDAEAARAHVLREVAGFVAALRTAAGDVVVVTNEVGMGLVPAYASGRLFRDLLGTTNAAVGDVADRLSLVVCGRVLDLTGADRVGP